MKNISSILIIFSLFLTLLLCAQPYSLTMYQNQDCKHCTYIKSVLEKIRMEPQISGLVSLTIVDCSVTPSECRDSFNPPLIEMRKKKENKKIAEIGGLRNYNFYLDWISEQVKQDHSFEVQKVQKGKYSFTKVSNANQIISFYEERNKIAQQLAIKNINPPDKRKSHKNSQRKNLSIDVEHDQSIDDVFNIKTRILLIFAVILAIFAFLIGKKYWSEKSKRRIQVQQVDSEVIRIMP